MIETSKPSLKFWVVAGVGLLWNLLGCYNFIMQTNPALLETLPEAYDALAKSRPGYATVAFAVAVFGGSLGCALMLMRRAVSRPFLLLSLLGVVVTMLQALWAIGFAPEAASVAMAAGISLAVATYLVWFTHRKSGQDLLW